MRTSLRQSCESPFTGLVSVRLVKTFVIDGRGGDVVQVVLVLEPGLVTVTSVDWWA